MAVYAGPNAVREGLILNLDAGDSKSFVPGTTTWRDTSGFNNNATMYGTVPDEIDVVRCFNFATVGGTFSYSATMGFTFSSNMIPTTGDFTISSWNKNPPAGIGQVGMFSNTGDGNGYRYGVLANYIYYLIGPTAQEGYIGFKSALNASRWYNVTTIFSRTTAKILTYVNGEFQNSVSIPASQTAFPAYLPGIVRSGCCALYTGKLATLSAYNKALSNNQILDSFDAIKGRFGY